MTRNAVNDPKVRHEVGEGGAPAEEGNRLVLLEEEYKAGAQALSRLGYNGNIFDIQLPRVKRRVFTDDEEKKIKALMVKGVINRSGALCNIGVGIINCGLMLEANRRLEEKKLQEEKDDAEVEKMKGLSDVDVALFHYGNWVTKGKQLNKKDKLDLSKAEAVAIVNVLLPKVDPTKKVSEYKTMGKCVDWLMNLAGGTTWEMEIEAMRNEHCAAALVAQPRLF